VPVSSSVVSVSVSSMSSAVSGGVCNVNAAPASVSATSTSSVSTMRAGVSYASVVSGVCNHAVVSTVGTSRAVRSGVCSEC